jgi:hypothetical protein
MERAGSLPEAPRRVWLLNLDAEDELARPGARTPSRAMIDRCRALAERLGGLVPPGDVAWVPGTDPPPCQGYAAAAWCPTPGARARLERVGARLPEAPPWAVLRAANHRAFTAGLGPSLPGAAFVRTEAELDAVLRAPSLTGEWLVKRPLSYRGNGRLRVRDAADPTARRWLRAALGEGDGLQVEPAVARLEDHGIHGFIARDRTVTWGALTRQRVDARGQWEATERVGDDALAAPERRALDEARSRVAEGLVALGYHGPFGIDAFRWRDPDGEIRYHPLCEVNARYSMGWAVGMSDRRVDLRAG